VTFGSYTIGSTTETTTATNSTFTKVNDFSYTGTITDDFNGDGTNDSVGFSLTLNQATDTYNVTVTTPPGSVTTTSSADGKLAAGGPDAVQTLLFGPGPDQSSGADDVVFFGVVATAPTDLDGANNDIFDLIVREPPASDLTEAQIEALNSPLVTTSTKMNVSTAGIGINNNNFDGDTNTAITSADESFVFNPEQAVDFVKVYIDNSVGGYNMATEDLYYTAYYTDGTVGTLTEANAVTNEAGGQVSFTVDGGTKQIDAVQLTMGRGTVKIPVIVWGTETTFNPQSLDLNFTATETDKDNDPITDTFVAHFAPDAIL
jgi:hypothetical protein